MNYMIYFESWALDAMNNLGLWITLASLGHEL